MTDEIVEDATRAAKRHGKAIERADIAVGHAAAEHKEHGVVRALGALSEVADQPPLIALSLATAATGLARGDRRLARTGLRMLAAHAVATGVKALVKSRIDRSRPGMFMHHHAHRITGGDTNEGPMNSFPSGHTAGALAVSRAVAREYPRAAWPGYAATAAVGIIQPLRGTHFPIDVAAGVVVGLASEWVVARILPDADDATPRHAPPPIRIVEAPEPAA